MWGGEAGAAAVVVVAAQRGGAAALPALQSVHLCFVPPAPRCPPRPEC